MDDKKTNKTEDRRVKRTKRVLRECLFKLLKEKSINEISVKELTEAADVNRSTFYFYYKDIHDMVRQIQDEIFDVFNETVIKPQASFVTVEDFTEYIIRFLLFCKEYESICKFVVNNDPEDFLATKIKVSLLEHIPDSKKFFPLSDSRAYLTGFAIYAIWNTVIDWMNDGMQTQPEEMAEFLARVYFYGGRTLLSQS